MFRLVIRCRVTKLHEARQAAERGLHETLARWDTWHQVHKAAAALREAWHALKRKELRL